MHFIGPSFSNCVSYFWENFHGHWLDTFCSLNKIKTLLVFFMFLFLKMLCSYLIWSCFCLCSWLLCFIIFFLYLHTVVWQRKKIKKLVPSFLFFKNIFGDTLVCGLNVKWMTDLLYGCLDDIDFHSALNQKLKKRSFRCSRRDMPDGRSSVKSEHLCQGGPEKSYNLASIT